MRGKGPYIFTGAETERNRLRQLEASNGQMSEILFPTSAFRFPSRLIVDNLWRLRP